MTETDVLPLQLTNFSPPINCISFPRITPADSVQWIAPAVSILGRSDGEAHKHPLLRLQLATEHVLQGL